MPRVECVVPYLAGCEHRERAWSWVRDRLPYPVRVGEGGSPWIKAGAVMPAIAASDAEIVVVHDADVWHPGLAFAVTAVERGMPWAIPHRGVFRLSAEGTERLRAGAENFERLGLDEAPYLGVMGGGIVVARRETLLNVPLDPRFIGWGQEDHSWGHALATLAGHPWRGRGPLVHLWHPTPARLDRSYGSAESRALWHRYRAALDNAEAMRALLEEAHALDPAQPNLLDRDPDRVG